MQVAAEFCVVQAVCEAIRQAQPGPGLSADDFPAGQVSAGGSEPRKRKAAPLVLLAGGHINVTRGGQRVGRCAVGLHFESYMMFMCPVENRLCELALGRFG